MSVKLIFFLISCFLCSGCGSLPVLPQSNTDEEKKFVYVVDHGWHTGIVVDARAAAAVIAGLDFDYNEIDFIEFGWGDRAFYQTDSFSLWLAVKALFAPTQSVMHVAGLKHDPKVYFRHSEIVRLQVPKSRFIEMLKFIDKSFERDGQGRPNRIGRGLYAYSAFYSATGHYHVFNNCNTWINEALSEAGITNKGAMALTASSVMRNVKNYRDSRLE